MGEGFILLTRGYGFMGGVPLSCTSTYDMKLKLNKEEALQGITEIRTKIKPTTIP